MAMNNDNLNELLEGLSKKQKRMKEVNEQLSSTHIEIEYYKGEIEAEMVEMTKDIKMKECELKENWRTVAELKTALRKVYFYNFLSCFSLSSFNFLFHTHS